jgi:excisionase family DNA binding protein
LSFFGFGGGDAGHVRDSDHLTTSQVARLCRVTANTVANWIDAGRLPAHRTPGGHRRVRRDDLARFMDEAGMPRPDTLAADGLRRALVVDPDQAEAARLESFLCSFDPEAEVRVAHDGFEAGRLAETHRPGLVLLDLDLPGVSGLEVCRSLVEGRRADPLSGETVVVGIAAHGTDEALRGALAAGALACLERPLDLERLRNLLERLAPREDGP